MHSAQVNYVTVVVVCLLALGVHGVVMRGEDNLASQEPRLTHLQQTRDASSSQQATSTTNQVQYASKFDASTHTLADPDASVVEGRNEQYLGEQTFKRYESLRFQITMPFSLPLLDLTFLFGTSFIASRQSQSMELDLNSTWTDASLATYLCETVDSTYTALTINGNGTYLKLPSCLPINATFLYTVRINEMVIESFAYVGSLVGTLVLQRCRFQPVLPASGTDGFNADGTVNWGEVWSLINPTLLDLSEGGLRGSLPTSLGQYIYTLRLQHNNFTGTLPSSLFTSMMNVVAYEFNFGYNQLTGTFPSSFFAHPAGLTALQGFYLFVDNNRLSGTLPSSLFLPFESQNLVRFTFDARNNTLSGSIPTQLITNQIVQSYTSTLTIDLAHNALEGTIPPTLFTNLTGLSYFNFSASFNKISGTLPPLLFPSGMSLSSGSTGIVLDLANNSITGTIPYGFLTLTQIATGVSPAWLNIAGNQLTGSIPNSLFNDFAAGTIMLTAARNQLNGSLPTFLASGNVFSLDVSSNLIEGPIPSVWQSQYPRDISLSDNPGINGTLLTTLFSSTGITSFSAKHTSLSGTLPSIGASLGVLELAYTNVDFCNASSSPISNFVGPTCDLSSSSACTCQASFLPCIASCPCSITTKPSGSAPLPPQCVDGVWSTASTLIIAAGSGVVTITGNLTSSSVRFSDAASSINVTGCADNLSEVLVELDDAGAREIGGSKVLRDLVTVADADENGTPCLNLTLVAVKSSTSGTCRKVKSDKIASQNNGKTLAAFFSVSSTSCNLWWIILAAVLGGAVLIAIVIIVICVTCCKSCKLKVRPYAASEGVYRT